MTSAAPMALERIAFDLGANPQPACHLCHRLQPDTHPHLDGDHVDRLAKGFPHGDRAQEFRLVVGGLPGGAVDLVEDDRSVHNHL